MKILLDQPRCEGHGACEEAAPEVYELDDEAVVVVRHEVQARAAVRALLPGDEAAPYRPSSSGYSSGTRRPDHPKKGRR